MRVLKAILLSIGLIALGGLTILGFAVWVLLPLAPAIAIFLTAVLVMRHKPVKTEEVSEEQSDFPKAA
jgi:hypothetical protein